MKIFFDVDGVLVDGWHVDPRRRNPWDRTLEEDLGVSRQALQDALFMPQAETGCSLMSQCARAEHDLKEVLAKILPKIGYRGTVDHFLLYWFERDSNLHDGVMAIVHQLAKQPGLDLYIATNQEPYRAAYLWQDLGFQEIFQDMFFSAELGLLKSEPAFFETVNQRLHIGLEERPLYFDDQAKFVAVARDCGWDGVVFNTLTDMANHTRLKSYLSSHGG